MNKFFGIGKILIDVNYNFGIRPNLFAVANTIIEIKQYYNSAENVILHIEGLNNIADKMYQQLFKGCNILLMGSILTNCIIQVFDFEILE